MCEIYDLYHGRVIDEKHAHIMYGHIRDSQWVMAFYKSSCSPESIYVRIAIHWRGDGVYKSTVNSLVDRKLGNWDFIQ